MHSSNKRILVIDDNPAIHEDFRKILSRDHTSINRELETLRADLFDDRGASTDEDTFALDSAFQGEEGVHRVEQACAAGEPYAMAFVDVRMPPGCDGIETIANIWNVYPDLEVVICTAYSSYTLDEIVARLGRTDRFVILKKPFDNVEVLQLATALTEKWTLSHALRQQLSQLEEMVQERTSQLQEANEHLAAESDKAIAAAAEARAASKAKSDFLSVMSHELRTPINGIVGMTSLLLARELDAEATDFVETIRTSSEVLSTLVNDVLDFSKIESGKLELESAAFDLERCAEEAMDLFSLRAFEKGLDLVIDIDPSCPRWLVGDLARLRQILVNLVGNAVKFTETGEVVLRIQPRELDGELPPLHFAVRDTGCGIPRDSLGRLFQSFSQLDSSTTRKYGGTGLGLAICDRLTALMGGTMWVQSEPGKGSTFQFAIPLRPATPPERSLSLAGPWSGKSILVVDPHETGRQALVTQLTEAGLTPLAVGTPQEAVAILRDRHMDFALVDFTVADFTRSDRSLVNLGRQAQGGGPVLGPKTILASYSCALNDQRLGLGTRPFDAFLKKPVTAHRLRDVLSRLHGGVGSPAAPRDSRTFDSTMASQLPLRILVAEDNPVSQMVAVRFLARMGYSPDVVSNGAEALEAVRRQSYDLILMDVQMPEMDGLEAARRITSMCKGVERPTIIALTANAISDDRQKCLDAGMDDYLPKPLDVSRLREALLGCSAKRRTTQMQSVASSLVFAEQRTRERLSRLLHDHLQQILFSALLHVQRAAEAAPNLATLKQAIRDLTDAIEETRSLSVELLPAPLRQGDLPGALLWLGESMQQKYGMATHITADARANPCSEEVRVLLFEAVRELLFNVVKHACIERANVTVALDDADQVRVTVTDTGVGFDLETFARRPGVSDGMGLVGMRERLALFGGCLTVDSAPGQGARFTIVVARVQVQQGV